MLESDNQRWQMILHRRDDTADPFVYGVKTTGIYCRSSCPSRRPKRVNVVFFDAPAEAEQAGFRACKRCRPSSGAAVERIAARGERVDYAIAECFLGLAMVAGTPRGICAIEFGGDSDELRRSVQERFPGVALARAGGDVSGWLETVLDFIERPVAGLALPLDIQGTAFQERVWAALRTIPPGVTVSYGELAAKIGKPTATRAVARACASNKIAIAIPCHRVVRGDGALSGYRWGPERKRMLLEREREATGVVTLTR
ncbi:MAG: methylated-DNA--[protein]-cysteine S-methyltransferase [Proteobacteria bacterium]|nr:methylated-DNA--[protein]-cysteine S-methyltransferase [Pseudomonadota bacterium]